jgi:hypothetical protein
MDRLGLGNVVHQEPKLTRASLGLLRPVSLQIFIRLSLFLWLNSICCIDEKLFFSFKRLLISLEVESIGDDIQLDSWLVLEPRFAHLDQLKVLIADKIGLLLSYFLLAGQLSLPEVLGI